MKIKLSSIYVENQDRALRFYTEVLGFVKKTDMTIGPLRWLTVVSPAEPDGTELVLEQTDHPATKLFQRTLFDEGIPLMAFAVDDIDAEFTGLRAKGVVFPMAPASTGLMISAVFEDTCGNLIQIYQPPRATP